MSYRLRLNRGLFLWTFLHRLSKGKCEDNDELRLCYEWKIHKTQAVTRRPLPEVEMNDVRPSLSPDGFRMILNWIISRIILRIMRPDVSFRFRSHEGGKKMENHLKKSSYLIRCWLRRVPWYEEARIKGALTFKFQERCEYTRADADMCLTVTEWRLNLIFSWN